MAIDINALSASEFCDLQGVRQLDRTTIERRHAKETLSYDNWYELISPDYRIGDKKPFTKSKSKDSKTTEK